MLKFLRDLAYILLVLPLTAGNKRSNKEYLDGSISMTLIILLWLAFMLVIIHGYCNVSANVNKNTFVHIYLTINIIVGVIASLILIHKFCCRDLENFAFFQGKNLVLKLRMVFLIIFFLGVCLKFATFTWRNSYCMKYLDIMLREFELTLIMDTCYNGVLFVFTLIQTLLIIRMAGYKFKKSIMITLCVLAMFGANTSVWLHTFEELHSTNNETNSRSETGIGCFLTNSSKIPTNGIFWFVKKSEGILKTTVLQYTLLSMNLLIEMWPTKLTGFRCSNPLESSKASYNTIHSSSNKTEANGQGCIPNNDDSYDRDNKKHGERQCLLQQRVDMSSDFSVSIDADVTTVPVRGNTKYLLASLVLAITMVIMMFAGCTIVNTKPWSSDSEYEMIFSRYVCVYKISIILALYLVLSSLQKNHELFRNGEFKTKEKILLIGFFFTFQYNLYKFIGISNYESWNYTFIVEVVASYLMDYVQLAAILQLSRMNLRKHVHFTLKCLLVFLMVMNFGTWLVDSTIGIKDKSFHRTFKLGLTEKNWAMIKNVIYPVMVYYRFSTVFAYAKHIEKL